MKICPQCKNEVNEASIYPSNLANYDYRCRICINAGDRKRYGGREQTRYSLWRNSGDPRKRALQSMLYRCRRRAKEKKLECTLTFKDLEVRLTNHCPILKMPYDFGRKTLAYSPSVDRIDNDLGYIPENIQIISQRANSMKTSASPEELIAFAEWVRQAYDMRTVKIENYRETG